MDGLTDHFLTIFYLRWVCTGYDNRGFACLLALELGVQDLVRLHLDLTRGSDRDGNLGAIARGRRGVLNRRDHIHALHNSAKHDVTSIQPGSLDSGDEELGSVRVLARVGHAQDTGTGVTELEVLVLKLGAIN